MTIFNNHFSKNKLFWLGVNGMEYISWENSKQIIEYNPNYHPIPSSIIHHHETITSENDMYEALKSGNWYQIEGRLMKDNPFINKEVDDIPDRNKDLEEELRCNIKEIRRYQQEVSSIKKYIKDYSYIDHSKGQEVISLEDLDEVLFHVSPEEYQK